MQKIFRSPAAFCFSLIIFITALLLFTFFLTRLELDPEIVAGKEVDRIPMVVVLPVDNPYTLPALQQISALTALIQEAVPHGEVANLFTLVYPRLRGEELAFVPVADRQNPRPGLIEEQVKASQVLQNGLLTRDGTAWVTYIRDIGDEAYETASELRRVYPDIKIGGAPYWNAVILRYMVKDIIRISLLGLSLMALVYLAITRNLGQAGVLFLASLTAFTGGVALFPIFGIAMTYITIAVPVLAMGFCTSYLLHLRSGCLSHPQDISIALRTHGSVVLLTAATTAAGLSSLLLQPAAELRILGLLGLAGLAWAVVCAFLSLPLQQRLLKNYKPPRQEVRNPPTKTIPNIHLKLRPKPRQAKLLITGILLLLLPGVFFAQARFTWSDIFWGHTQIGRDVAYIEKQAPGFQDLYIRLELPGEYPWVDMTRYRALDALFTELRRDFPETILIGPVEVVEEVLARFSGLPDPEPPRNEMELGEAYELLALREGLPLRVIDGSFSVVSAAARGSGEWSELSGLMQEIQTRSAGLFPEARVEFSGLPTTMVAYDREFLPAQVRAITLFTLLVFSMCLVWFRSLPRAAAVLLPPAGAIWGVVGVAGYLGWPLSIVDGVAFALIAGIGVDDAILVRMLPNAKLSRLTVIYTTLLLAAVFSVLVISSFFRLFRLGVMVVLGLAFSTSVVLLTHTPPDNKGIKNTSAQGESNV